MSVQFERDIVERILANPLVRTEETRDILEGAGIVPGPVKTWYYAPPEVWSKIRAYVLKPH